jgi:tetratricopeptide (TPR) repeat protein
VKRNGLIIFSVLLLTGCAGVRQVKVDFYLPPEPVERTDPALRQGWDALRQGYVQKAIASFTNSQAEPSLRHLALGYAFLAQEKYATAEQQFDEVLAAAPENTDAEIGLAIAEERTQQYEQAFQRYAKLLTKNPEHTWLRLRHDFLKTTRTEYHLQLSETAKAAGNNDQYLYQLEKAAFYSPEMISLQSQIGDFYYLAQNWEKARSHYETIIEKQPFQEEVLRKLADIYQKTGKIDLALVVLDRLQEMKPEDGEIEAQRSLLQQKMQESPLPAKFKNIFSKSAVNREELVALIGYYFANYFSLAAAPEIITDIDGSFAREDIIKLCSLKIMAIRPDHTFDRFSLPNRALFAQILHSLIDYLEKQGHQLHFGTEEALSEPTDISPLHRDYDTIRFLIQAQILHLDLQGNFNPTGILPPLDAVAALQKILHAILN